MNRLFIMFFACLVSWVGIPKNANAAVSETQVRGLSWGTKCSAKPELVRPSNPAPPHSKGTYAKLNENPLFFGIPIKTVVYHCSYGDRLGLVMIYFDSVLLKAMYNALSNRWGNVPGYDWKSPNGKIEVNLGETMSKGTHMIVFFNRALQAGARE